MPLEDALARGRTAALERMRDTCRITKPGEGRGEKNYETGQYDKPAPVVVYEGPCRIPRRSAGMTSGGGSAAGDASWKVGEFPLDLPIDHAGYAGEVGLGMTVEYLTSLDQPDLVGHVFGISEISRQSQATARRFRMKEVVGS